VAAVGKRRLIEIMDTTLRDGEQTQGVSFSPEEKLGIAKMLLNELKVDRIEAASALVSPGEMEAVKSIVAFAAREGFLPRVEILGFVDFNKSVRWVRKAGGRTLNLLTKGSLKHCTQQLGKPPEQHFKDIGKTIGFAKKNGMDVNVYLEDWSNGMIESRQYLLDLMRSLEKHSIERVFLADTLGVLSPRSTERLVGEMVEAFPETSFEFHAHNDYGLAVANSLEAVEAGCGGLHVTLNGLGERAGNAPLDEVATAIRDHTVFGTKINEKSIFRASKMVETFSGKRLGENKPICGESVFTQTAGIHADGDKKGNLYVSRLVPERFGREREYALGKLSGKASLEMNLRRLGMELSPEQKKVVLDRIVRLGEKKERVTMEDLPYIVADVLQTPAKQGIKIVKCIVSSGKGITPNASFLLRSNGREISASGVGDGGYDAFMKALGKAVKKLGMVLPQLADYEVRIPPGGKTDALVETTITWQENGTRFRTIGVDSDQVMAAVKATEKMLNIIARK
jgi:D-citramalate synthase